MHIKQIGMTYLKGSRLLTPQSAVITANGIQHDREFMLLDASFKPIRPNWHRYFIPFTFNYSHLENCISLRLPNATVIKQPCELTEQVEFVDYTGIRKIAVRRVVGPWDDILSDAAKKPITLVRCEPLHTGVDILPLSVITSGSVARLEKQLNQKIDPRMFRANLLFENDQAHIEDEWENQQVRIGAAVIKIRSSIPRCVITQLDPVTGRNICRTVAGLSRYRAKTGLPDGLLPGYSTPGFGSYAEVVKTGDIHVGDEALLI